MIKLQNPDIPQPTKLVEIDKAIYELQLKLDTSLLWLSHNYARAYRFIELGESRLYFPEVYIAGESKSYYRVTPDNDKSGMCFFVVGNETQNKFERNSFNYLSWNVGIIFSVNLELIDSALLKTEYFQQNLIKEVREVLTKKLGGLSFVLEIDNVTTNFNEIYSEFSLNETEGYLRSPLGGFRFNCTITLQEECATDVFDAAAVLNKNLSSTEKGIIISNADFSDSSVLAYLSEEQKADICNA